MSYSYGFPYYPSAPYYGGVYQQQYPQPCDQQPSSGIYPQQYWSLDYGTQQQPDISGMFTAFLQPILGVLMALLTQGNNTGAPAGTPTGTPTGTPAGTPTGTPSDSDRLTSLDAYSAQLQDIAQQNGHSSIQKSDLTEFSKSSDSTISQDAKDAAKWLASTDGIHTFKQLDAYKGSTQDGRFTIGALDGLANDTSSGLSTGVTNGQTCFDILSDSSFTAQLKTDGIITDDGYCNMTKLNEAIENKDGHYTQDQVDALQYLVDNPDLLKLLSPDADDDNRFTWSKIHDNDTNDKLQYL